MQTLPETTKLTRAGIIARVTAMAEDAAVPAGIEIVEVELKGSGRHHLLRIYIDRAQSSDQAGVSHADCELVSRAVSDALDAEDPIPGSYELQVSSPGVERKLARFEDWVRFCGRKAKVVLKHPVKVPNFSKRTRDDIKSFDGNILKAENHTVTMELAGGATVTFPIEDVDRANLRFEW